MELERLSVKEYPDSIELPEYFNLGLSRANGERDITKVSLAYSLNVQRAFFRPADFVILKTLSSWKAPFFHRQTASVFPL